MEATVRRLWWMVLGVEMGRAGWERRRISIGFAKEQHFQFGVKELWRNGKGRGLSSFIGWVRYLSQCWREFVPERRDSYAMERLENLSDEVTEGRSSVRVDEDRVERGGWMVNSPPERVCKLAIDVDA